MTARTLAQRRKDAAVALVVLLIAGCTPTPEDANSKTLSGMGMGIQRYYDAEYRIACYRYYGYGISCVKVSP